jgi:long-subunit acyl-CoA synthetase (AMP-forming)
MYSVGVTVTHNPRRQKARHTSRILSTLPAMWIVAENVTTRLAVGAGVGTFVVAASSDAVMAVTCQ